MNQVVTKDDAKPVTQDATLIDMIERVAMNPDADIDKMERLMQMRVEMETRNAEKEFNSSMAQCQMAMPKIEKKGYNKQTSSRYEELDDLIDQIKPVYSGHGFAPTFDTFVATQPDHEGMICTLVHIGGHSKEYRAEIPSSGLGIKGNRMMTETHGFASTTTYGRRYMLKLIFNISTGEDNDGNGMLQQPINADQYVKLRDKMEVSGVEEQTILQAYGAASLQEFPNASFQSVMKRLDKTIEATK